MTNPKAPSGKLPSQFIKEWIFKHTPPYTSEGSMQLEIKAIIAYLDNQSNLKQSEEK